jgi:hypothetical protein
MMSAPAARTSAGFIALTVAAVPTGMKAGVRISPRATEIRPVRAAPWVAAIENEKREDVTAAALSRRSRGVEAPRARRKETAAGLRTLTDPHGIGIYTIFP